MKKSILFAISPFVFNVVFSQNKIYNNTVNKPENVTFKTTNGNLYITRADTVIIGQIIINQSIKHNFKISSYSQIKDSSGLYLTTFLLVNIESSTTSDVNLTLKFNDPVESVFWGSNGVQAISIGTGHNPDNNEFIYQAAQVISRSKEFQITIRSKTAVFPILKGVETD